MTTKEKSLIGYAFIVNAVQIILCFVIYFLRKFDIAGFIVTQGILFITQIGIWFICGAACALGLNIQKMKNSLLYSLIALLPIIIITSVCAVLGFTSDADVGSWEKYFFLGSAVNFWHRPAVILSVIIKNSAYSIFAINLAILFCASVIGANYGMILNLSKQRKSKAKMRIKKVTKEKPVKTLTPEAETISETKKTSSETAGEINEETTAPIDDDMNDTAVIDVKEIIKETEEKQEL